MIKIDLLETEFDHNNDEHFESINTFYFDDKIVNYLPNIHSYKLLSDLKIDLYKHNKNLTNFLHNEDGPAWIKEDADMEAYYLNGEWLHETVFLNRKKSK